MYIYLLYIYALLLHKKIRVTSPPMYLQRNSGHVTPPCFHCFEGSLKDMQLKYLHKDNTRAI